MQARETTEGTLGSPASPTAAHAEEVCRWEGWECGGRCWVGFPRLGLEAGSEVLVNFPRLGAEGN